MKTEEKSKTLEKGGRGRGGRKGVDTEGGGRRGGTKYGGFWGWLGVFFRWFWGTIVNISRC